MITALPAMTATTVRGFAAATARISASSSACSASDVRSPPAGRAGARRRRRARAILRAAGSSSGRAGRRRRAGRSTARAHAGRRCTRPRRARCSRPRRPPRRSVAATRARASRSLPSSYGLDAAPSAARRPSSGVTTCGGLGVARAAVADIRHGREPPDHGDRARAPRERQHAVARSSAARCLLRRLARQRAVGVAADASGASRADRGPARSARSCARGSGAPRRRRRARGTSPFSTQRGQVAVRSASGTASRRPGRPATAFRRRAARARSRTCTKPSKPHSSLAGCR